MAILENIRKRTTVLILIIGMALFAFVISGVFTGNDFAGGKIGSTIAEINGEPISREEFTKKLEQAQRQFGPNFSSTQLVNRVYDQEIRGAILNQQFEKLGIDVESDQIVDFIKNTGYAQDPSFQDENGVFNPEVFKATIADWKETNPLLYDNWLELEKQIMQSAKEQIYFNLIKAGTGATLTEGEFDYKLANDKVDFQYVRVPYASIPDSTIQVSKEEIATYIKEHEDEFEQEKARDIRFVFFEEKASAADENVVKEELNQLLGDTVEYIQERNTTDTIPGFRTTTTMAAFLDRNSDAKFDTIFKAKKDLPAVAADSIFNLGDREIYGPYRDGDFFKVSRIMARKPNGSVKASHILFAYEGATRANPDITRTKEEAEEEANKILAEAKKTDADFTTLARDNSDGPSAPRGGDLGYFQEGIMADAFNDFCFGNEVGAIGLVETEFGFHIIKVDDKQDIVQVATLSREIQPSEETVNMLFTDATKLEMAVTDAEPEAFTDIAKEGSFTVRPVNKIKEMDENLPGLNSQRTIVQWAFNEDTNVGDIKRFDLTNGYAIVQLTKKYKKGTMSVEDASSQALPKIRREKKAGQIMGKATVTTLEDFATNHGVTTSNASAVTRKAPTIPGAGREPLVVGKAFSLAEGENSPLIKGETGVFMVKLTKKDDAVSLPNYSTFTSTLIGQNRNSVNAGVYDALKEESEIEDNRATFY
ncbi:MAG: SurA N-terminal domain-containing protein [Bacteroidota bacterium]